MMRQFLGLVLCVALLIGCAQHAAAEEGDTLSANKGETMEPRVTGIGGVFFKSKDPKAVREWYSKHLGMKTDQYGTMFEFRLSDNPDKIGYLQWSPFSESTDYFDPSEREFMINYRVQNLEQLLKNLEAGGVKIIGEVQSYDYGKFAHIMDPEGNKIELWEPVDSTFTKDDEGDKSD